MYNSVVWMTGLSGSGKTTIALKLKEKINDLIILDGDCIRNGLNKDLGFGLNDRLENIRRIAHVAKLISDSGHPVVVPAITPTEDIREMAKKIVGDQFSLLWVKASLETCIRRDPKGLYKKVLNGEIKNFTGFDSPFNIPCGCTICDTEINNIDRCADKVIKELLADSYSI